MYVPVKREPPWRVSISTYDWPQGKQWVLFPRNPQCSPRRSRVSTNTHSISSDCHWLFISGHEEITSDYRWYYPEGFQERMLHVMRHVGETLFLWRNNLPYMKHSPEDFSVFQCLCFATKIICLTRLANKFAAVSKVHDLITCKLLFPWCVMKFCLS